MKSTEGEPLDQARDVVKLASMLVPDEGRALVGEAIQPTGWALVESVEMAGFAKYLLIGASRVYPIVMVPDGTGVRFCRQGWLSRVLQVGSGAPACPPGRLPRTMADGCWAPA